MTVANRTDAIQNTLVALATGRSFPVISYAVQATGGARSTDTMTTVVPRTVLAWKESDIYDVPRLRRRDGKQRESQGSIWRLQIQFDRAVSLDEFEDVILASTPTVSRNLSIGIDHLIYLEMNDAEYVNPVTQQPAQGTKVTYRFTALPTPN